MRQSIRWHTTASYHDNDNDMGTFHLAFVRLVPRGSRLAEVGVTPSAPSLHCFTLTRLWCFTNAVCVSAKTVLVENTFQKKVRVLRVRFTSLCSVSMPLVMHRTCGRCQQLVQNVVAYCLEKKRLREWLRIDEQGPDGTRAKEMVIAAFWFYFELPEEQFPAQSVAAFSFFRLPYLVSRCASYSCNAGGLCRSPKSQKKRGHPLLRLKSTPRPKTHGRSPGRPEEPRRSLCPVLGGEGGPPLDDSKGNEKGSRLGLVFFGVPQQRVGCKGSQKATFPFWGFVGDILEHRWVSLVNGWHTTNLHQWS